MLKKLAVLAALLASPAAAQSVQQSGNVTPGHVPWWVTNGVIGDGGTASDSPISSLGITNNGGPGLCVSTGRVTAAGRQQLCLSASLNGAASVTLQNYGSATPQALNFVINGITYSFPGSLSEITIGTTPVVGGTVDNCLYVNASNVVDNKACSLSSIVALTGDVTAVGPGTVPATLATVNVNTGTFGSATTVASPTVNGKGLITAISNIPIALPAGQITGTTLPSNIINSSLQTLGTISSGVWQGTVVGPTYGGTGVNNGSSTLTLGANLATTGTSAPTFAFPSSTTFTYTFQNSSDTMVGRATTDTLTNKTLTTPTINGAALSGTLSGTPTLSGANFVTNANLAQAAAATLKGNVTASLANVADFTVQGLVDISAPSATLDWLLVYNHSTGTLEKTNANELLTVVGAGVTSLNSLAGSLTLANGNGIASIGTGGSTITVSADIAATAAIWAGTANKVLDAGNTFGAAGAFLSLTGTSTVTPVLTNSFNFSFLATSATNYTLANPTLTTALIGRQGCIYLAQPASGSVVTISYGTFWWSAGGSSARTLTPTLGAQDRLCYLVVSTTEIDFTMANAIAH